MKYKPCNSGLDIELTVKTIVFCLTAGDIGTGCGVTGVTLAQLLSTLNIVFLLGSCLERL